MSLDVSNIKLSQILHAFSKGKSNKFPHFDYDI